MPPHFITRRSALPWQPTIVALRHLHCSWESGSHFVKVFFICCLFTVGFALIKACVCVQKAEMFLEWWEQWGWQCTATPSVKKNESGAFDKCIISSELWPMLEFYSTDGSRTCVNSKLNRTWVRNMAPGFPHWVMWKRSKSFKCGGGCKRAFTKSWCITPAWFYTACFLM